jgi:hypothetical protein
MPAQKKAQISSKLGVSKFEKCFPRAPKCARLKTRVQGSQKIKNRANGFLVLKGLAFF